MLTFPAPTGPPSRRAERRGWEERSRPEPRAGRGAPEHGEDGEHRTFPGASTAAPSRVGSGARRRAVVGAS